MPDAAPDPALVERFRHNLGRLTDPAVDLGVALSGGPDSTALLLLAVAALPGRVRALTVDHGLRAEAATEATAAAALCATLDVPHEIATVSLARASQAAAREARYRALVDWARRHGLRRIATAHHADDQAETLLMRLARGAGSTGLAGIRACRTLAAAGGASILVVRPLLGWRKAELEDVVRAAGIVPARDPSNADPRYDRTAARALLADAAWLDPRRLAAAAAHLAEADDTLALVADQRYAVEQDGADTIYRPDPLRHFARRHLRRLFTEVFDAHPDGPALERTLTRLADGADTTAADILCRVDPPVWRFRRAPPRRRP